MNPILLLSVLLSLVWGVAYSQSPLEQQIDEGNAHSLTLFGDPDSLMRAAAQTYALAKDSEYRRGWATAAKIMGAANYFHSRFDESIMYYQEALGLYEQLNDTLEMAKANLNMATTYSAQSNYEATINHAVKSLDGFRHLGDANGEGRVFNLMGVAASAQTDHAKALSYFKQHLEKVSSVSDSVEIASSYNNIGSTFKELGEIDSAIHYLLLAEQLNAALGFDRNNGSVYQNLGSLHEGQGNFSEANRYNEAALTVYRATGNRKQEADLLMNMGMVSYKQRRLDDAESFFEQSIALAKEVGNVGIIASATAELALVKADRGSYREAYEYQREASGYKDSVFAIERIKSTQELQTRFETKQQEQRIELLDRQHTIQQLSIRQRNFYLLAAVILLAGAILVAWYIYRTRKAKERQLSKEAELKAELLQAEALNALQQDRLRISRELHDNIGSHLTFIKSVLSEPMAENSQAWLQVQQLADDTLRELRKTVWLINRASVGTDEFVVKLREYVAGHPIVSVTADVDAAWMIESNLATQLFRVVQEAVTNALKHAQATAIVVHVLVKEKRMSIVVRDNGRGFNPKIITEGYGLENMRARMENVNVHFALTSVSGQGTSITLMTPEIYSTRQDSHILS